LRNFQRLATGVNVAPLSHALQRKPHLWNADRLRTTFEGSPHAQVDDILLRFEDLSLQPDEPGFQEHAENAERVFKPAWSELPEARAIILPLMQGVGAYELARAMVTRLRPGGRITPHADTNGKYANLPDIGRYHVVIQGLVGSVFACGEERVEMLTGDVWWFNAHEVHECINCSGDDRIHMLVDVRLM
jgi:hypothetical protein